MSANAAAEKAGRGLGSRLARSVGDGEDTGVADGWIVVGGTVATTPVHAATIVMQSNETTALAGTGFAPKTNCHIGHT
jgi:hypothetical protein